MIRIYADFNNSDEQGYIRLDCKGSRDDIDRHHDKLMPGLEVVLYMTDEFEVHGTLDNVLGYWRAMPDYRTIEYYDVSEDTQ